MLSFGDATGVCTKRRSTLNMYSIVLVKTWRIKINKSVHNSYVYNCNTI